MEKGAALAIPPNPSAALVRLAEQTSRYGLSGTANTAKAYAGDLKRWGLVRRTRARPAAGNGRDARERRHAPG